MAADEKILVVVGVHEGKFFPPRPGYRLVVEARFSGESLISDPVDHGAGGRIELSTELAWEMTRKALQEHKLQRTPIKLVCVAVNDVTKRKQEIGYVLLDLKSAQQLIPPKVVPWYGLLRCQYAGKRPELRVSLTIEQNSSSVYSTSSVTSGGEDASLSLPTVPVVGVSRPNVGVSLPPMVLDQTNGWYLLGSPTPQHSLHTVSLTLSQPHNLHPFINRVKGPYYFKYSLLGNDITTEEFNSLNDPTDFHPERASVRIRTSPSLMEQLLVSQSDMEISLYSSSKGVVMCTGVVPVSSLASSQTVSITCPLNVIKVVGVSATPTVGVTLSIQQEKASATSLTTKGGVASLLSNKQDDNSSSARRNLAQTLEEASSSVSSATPPRSPSPRTPPTGNSPQSSTSAETTPTRPYSPTITTPTVNAPSLVKFTLPKTSPLLMSNSSRSPNRGTSHGRGTSRGRMSTNEDHNKPSSGHTHSSQPLTTNATIGIQTLSIGTSSAPPTSVPSRSILKPSSANAPPTYDPSHSVITDQYSYQPHPITLSDATPPIGIPQYTSSIPPQYQFGHMVYPPPTHSIRPPPPGNLLPPHGNLPPPHGNLPPPHGNLPPPHGNLPPPHGNLPPHLLQPLVIQQQQMEYQTAMELEMWKMAQEQAFKKELKEKEQSSLKMLEEEYCKRDTHREQLVKQKIAHYHSLEEQLEKTLSEVETQRKRMKTKELEINALQQKLNDERRSLQTEVDRERNRLKTDHTTKSELERLRSKELNQQLDRAHKQIVELETRLSQRNTEYDALRDHVHNKSDSRVQAELSVMQLEKKELEQKLDASIKSKLHYKEQWSKAMKEVAVLKQREQTVMKEQLKKQQQELELMRDKYLQTEEQQQLHRQLSDLRHETQRLQAHALSRTIPIVPSHLPPHPPPILHPSSPSNHHGNDPDSDIAGWIEERNILLQTGVYTHSDPTVQKLDRKIREALVAKSSSHEEQSSSY